jgi:hypothetical protein
MSFAISASGSDMTAFGMPESTLTPEQCTEHAQACRDMARKETDPEVRKRLEDVAAAWEHLCEELEKLTAPKN